MVVRELITLLGFEVNEKGLREYKAKVKALNTELSGVGKKMSMFLTVPIVALGAYFVKTASDSTEAVNRFGAVFRDILPEAMGWLDQFTTSVGRSKKETMEGASAFMGMAVGLGLGAGEAFQMATRLHELAIDFASFNNLTDRESVSRFISAMAGSSQVLDMFGINIKESAMALKLQQLGFAASSQRATEAQKAVARLAIIEETMGRQGAIGDAVKTGREFANTMKRVGSEIEKLAVEYGKILLPYVKEFTNALIGAIHWLDQLSPAQKKTIVMFTAIAAVIGPAIVAVTAIVSLFMTVSPVVAAVAAGIGALVAIFVVLWEDFMVWKEGGESVLGDLFGSFEEFKNGVLYVMGIVKTVLAEMWPSVRGVIRMVIGAIELVIGLLLGRTEWVIDAMKRMLSGFFDFMIKPIKDLVLATWEGIKATFEVYWKWLKDKWDLVKSLMPGFLKKAGTAIDMTREFFAGPETVGVGAMETGAEARIAGATSNLTNNNVRATFNIQTAPGTTAEQAAEISEEVSSWLAEDIYANNPEGED